MPVLLPVPKLPDSYATSLPALSLPSVCRISVTGRGGTGDMSLVWNGREEHRVDDSLPQKDNGQPRQGGWVGVSTFCIRPQIILLHDGHRAPRAPPSPGPCGGRYADGDSSAKGRSFPLPGPSSTQVSSPWTDPISVAMWWPPGKTDLWCFWANHKKLVLSRQKSSKR